MKKLLLLLFITLSSFIYSGVNDTILGTVEGKDSTLIVTAQEKGNLLFSDGSFVFTFDTRASNFFLNITNGHIELINLIDTEDIKYTYNRSAGRMQTLDFAKIYFKFISNGNGVDGCTIIMTVETVRIPDVKVYHLQLVDIENIRGFIATSRSNYEQYKLTIKKMNDIIDSIGEV